jgi:hypothetical protein
LVQKKKPSLPIIVLNINISDMVEVVADHKCESDPPILLLCVHSKKDHEENQLGKDSELKYGIIAQESHVTQILQISVQRLPFDAVPI